MSYKKIQNYYFGNLDASISSFYMNFPEFFNNLSLLITCLDSDSNLSNNKILLGLFDKINCEYKIINEAIFVNSKNTNRLFENNKILTHFDEIYLFDKDVYTGQAITRLFTSDRYNFISEVPTEFIDLFNSIGAKRYVSDGCGLNFVCESEKIASKTDELY